MKTTRLAPFALILMTFVPPATADQENRAHGEDSLAAMTRWTQLELQAERSCDKHQRPRPCRAPDGTTAFQCVARSPLAAVLHWLEGAPAPPDDDVRIVVDEEVVRDAPESDDVTEAAAAAGTRQAQAGKHATLEANAHATRNATTHVVVVPSRGERPACRQ